MINTTGIIRKLERSKNLEKKSQVLPKAEFYSCNNEFDRIQQNLQFVSHLQFVITCFHLFQNQLIL